MNAETAPRQTRKILVIDDNPIIQRTVHLALRNQGYQVLTGGEVSDGMKIIRQEKLDLGLADLSIPLLPADIGICCKPGFSLLIGFSARRTSASHRSSSFPPPSRANTDRAPPPARRILPG